MRSHTAKQRQEYRERINRVKPWLKSTGAKTAKGKEISKMNALKTDPIEHKIIQDYKILMRNQKEIIGFIG